MRLLDISADFEGWIYYNQSSTEPGNTYGVSFELVDPTPTTYDATFTVTDESTTDPISGADVTITGQGTQTTNGSGQTTFTGLEDGTYNYSVVASGYVTENGSITVDGGNVTESVAMTPESASTYVANFHVYDVETNADIEGATVSISGYGSAITDVNGECAISGLPDGTYDYTVTADHYDSSQGQVTISGSDEHVEVSMLSTKYNVEFTVKYGASLIEGATVTVAGYDPVVTGGAGTALFNLPVGTYSYKVFADGYTTMNDNVAVDGDMFVDVNLQPTAIDDVIGGANISIYPNPVTTTLFIKDTHGVELVSIVDITGKVVYTTAVDGDVEVDFLDMISGLYFVKLQTDKNIFTYKISKQ